MGETNLALQQNNKRHSINYVTVFLMPCFLNFYFNSFTEQFLDYFKNYP